VQDDAEVEDSKYTISVSVISPKKVGDGVGAYMVYKVVTKVLFLKFSSFSLFFQLITYCSLVKNCNRLAAF